jgi:hypothetical protein
VHFEKGQGLVADPSEHNAEPLVSTQGRESRDCDLLKKDFPPCTQYLEKCVRLSTSNSA